MHSRPSSTDAGFHKQTATRCWCKLVQADCYVNPDMPSPDAVRGATQDALRSGSDQLGAVMPKSVARSCRAPVKEDHLAVPQGY